MNLTGTRDSACVMKGRYPHQTDSGTEPYTAAGRFMS